MTKKKLIEVMTLGSAGVAVLFILMANFGFNSEPYYHDDKIGVQFGMMMDIEAQESYIWVKLPGAIVVKTTFYNVFKVDKNGDKLSKGLSDLIPLSKSQHGTVDLNIEMSRVNETSFPDLDSRNHRVIPMGYLSRDSTFISYFRYILLIWSIVLTYWNLFTMLAVLNAVGCIIVGIIFISRNRKKKRIVITAMKEMESQPRRTSVFSILVKNDSSGYKARPGSLPF